MSSALPSSGYCDPNPSLGLLIPVLVSPGITPPTAEASPSSVLSVLHTPTWLLLPAMSSSQCVLRSFAVQRGSPGSTRDNEQVLKLNEENISKLAKYTGAEGVSMKEYALALLGNQS